MPAQAKATALEEYLSSLPNMQTVSAITIRIGRTEYVAVHYWQRAAHNGAPYTVEAIYVLGQLPAAYRRSTHVAFTLDNDTREWYVASYYQTIPPNEYHPFGPMFQLRPWSVPSGERIDYHAPQPYQRMHIGAY